MHFTNSRSKTCPTKKPNCLLLNSEDALGCFKHPKLVQLKSLSKKNLAREDPLITDTHTLTTSWNPVKFRDSLRCGN